MKAGVFHCVCVKCASVPVRKRVRRREVALSLLSLPEELLLCVVQRLTAHDLLAIRAVHSRLRDVVDSNSRVWARVSFRQSWPSPDTVWLFKRAAEKGNFEAAVKLGIAYLYNEGPSLSKEGRADLCGRMASHYFSLAESLRPPQAEPFVWLFIRPPWSMSGGCCKAVVYDRLRAESDSDLGRRGTLLYCLARVLYLVDEQEKQEEAGRMLEEASRCGHVHSSYLLLEMQRETLRADPARHRQCKRALQDYAARGCWAAQVVLAGGCASVNPLEPWVCSKTAAHFFQSGPPALRIQRGPHHDDLVTKRYILVDWLVEVATMKDFSSQVLHVTIGCIDRFLASSSVTKDKLQLLGIACMVISSRYLSSEILTIREAVWLTDNTYKYEDLVRMMGEVIAVLDGKIRAPTVLDYGGVLLALLPVERRSAHLFRYIAELSLLCSPLTLPGPAHLASAIVLLTRALHSKAPLWPLKLQENTGFSQQDLVSCAVSLYVKCFGQDVPTDYRHVSLTGVKQRFEESTYQHISRDVVMGLKELCQVLEVTEQEEMEASRKDAPLTEMEDFLSSPSSSSKRRRADDMQAHRGSFLATPTPELSNQEESLLGDFLDWSLDSSCSGYEGDQESDEERDGDVSVIQMRLLERRPHGCSASSDEDDEGHAQEAACESGSHARPWFSSLSADHHSSGYCSIHSASSPLTAPRQAPPPILRPRGQVKRKNAAAHSAGEEGKSRGFRERGFLSL